MSLSSIGSLGKFGAATEAIGEIGISLYNNNKISNKSNFQYNEYIDKDNYLIEKKGNYNKIYKILFSIFIIIYLITIIRIIYKITNENKPPYMILIIFIILSIFLYYTYFEIVNIITLFINNNILFKI